MYRLLIVDDEKVEREGMAQFVPWEKYDTELIGTAWNGIEALEMIRKSRPDIVLTDIKMPVMNGIELIKEAKKIYPDMEFVVLSGYGEYEFTSKAMEEGVRYYILKPFDEEKIAEVLEKVIGALREKRMHESEEEMYKMTVRQMLPRAKEQVLRNLLLGREQIRDDYQLFLKEIGAASRKVMVLAVRDQEGQEELDYLLQFVIGNILGELLGEGEILMSACIRNEIYFLLNPVSREKMGEAVERMGVEFAKMKFAPLCAALSEEAALSEVNELYRQTQELFRIGKEEQQQGFFYYGMFENIKEETGLLVNYQMIRRTKDFAELLFEIYLAYLKMKLKEYTQARMEEVFIWTGRILYGEQMPGGSEDEWELIENTVLWIAERKGLRTEEGKGEQRARDILLAVYRNMENPEMSIQYLARNVLFMNEDYFGRIFLKSRKEKFSVFLVEVRIELAKRLIQYKPEAKISDIVTLVGFAPDGQYFSKMFKKTAEISPTEYREMVNSQKDRL